MRRKAGQSCRDSCRSRENTGTVKALSFQTDRELRISSWGEEIARFTGKSLDVSLGKKYYEVLPFVSFQGRDALAEAVIRKQPLTIPEHRIPCMFTHIDADIDIRPELSSKGDVTAVEITLSPHATCAVARKLTQSQKLINIGKIASTLAHGVRNPLNAIKGAVVYLSEKYKDEALLVEFTKIIEEEISRLDDFITKFLSSSVSETDIRTTDINSILKKIEVFISLQIYTRNISSLFEFGTVPPVTINTFHLEQGILNVINNAIDAMDEGGRLGISTSSEIRDGKTFVVIAVSDSGCGLPETVLGEFPVENSEHGKGFGLFITYEILKHYGGFLEIDSIKDKGTTIKLFIPCTNTNEVLNHDRQQKSSHS